MNSRNGLVVAMFGIVVLGQSASGARADGLTARTFKFQTSDGVSIAATYYAPRAQDKGEAGGDAGAKAPAKPPVAVLIHMYPADRNSWDRLVPSLHDAGFAVLAYDIRGKGGSKEPKEMKLAEKYEKQDSELFKAAWHDVEGSKTWLAQQPECDVSRLVMIGASIGCSISLDYGSRDEAVKAIVCLSPGPDYFGVDSISHIKKCGKKPILLMSPESEYGNVEKLIKASDGAAKGSKHPGGRENHGTGMFNASDRRQVIKEIVDFVKPVIADEKGKN